MTAGRALDKASVRKQTLGELAKEWKIESKPEKRLWSEVPRNYCFSKKRVERAVDVALSNQKQATLRELKRSFDECVYALKHKNTDKDPALTREGEIRVKQSQFLYKEWERRLGQKGGEDK